VHQLNSRVDAILEADFGEMRRAGGMHPPVMSYIELEKFVAAGSDFVEAQQRRLREWISSAKRIAIVGVSVHPIDRHIWGPLAAAPGEILYAGPGRSADEFVN
jgi:hypothetical protein